MLHGQRRTRTADTTIFSRVLYQLSYLAATLDAICSTRFGDAPNGSGESSARVYGVDERVDGLTASSRSMIGMSRLLAMVV
jgi:hypothetical protein